MNKFNTEESIGNSVSHNGLDLEDAYIAYSKQHYRNTMPDSRILVFLTGFCIGMVLFYFSGAKGLSDGDHAVGLLDREHLTLLQNFEADRLELFEYVFGIRIRQLIFWIVCTLSSIGGLLAYSIIGWYGFETGLIIFSLVYAYGIKGILLTLSMFLPHGICYLIVFLIVFNKFWANDTKYYHKEKTVMTDDPNKKLGALKRITLVLAVFGAGLLCEIYLNPEIVKKIVALF